MRGHNRRKPTAIKILEGNRGHRPLNPDEPKVPTRAVIACPNWLTEKAQGEWRRVMTTLVRMPGLLTTCDRAVLAGYCQAWARWREAEEAMKKGLTVCVESRPGCYTDQVNPNVKISKIYYDEMMRAASMLGFSPSDRGGVHLLPNASEKIKPDELTPPPRKAPHMLVEGHKKS
jgi:P27 family predicted phage terminase small subunit